MKLRKCLAVILSLVTVLSSAFTAMADVAVVEEVAAEAIDFEVVDEAEIISVDLQGVETPIVVEVEEVMEETSETEEKTEEVKETTEISASNEGLSYYVVEFTYGNLQYLIDAESENIEVKVSTILASLGINETVTAVDEAMPWDPFTVVKDDAGDDWTVKVNYTSTRSFGTIKVTTTAGNGYGITLTLYQGETYRNWKDLQNAINEAADDVSTELKLDNDIEGFTGKKIRIPAGKIIVLDMNGKTIKKISTDRAGSVIEVAGKLTLTSNGGTGTITSTPVDPTDTDGGRGIKVENGGELIMQDHVSITGNRVYGRIDGVENGEGGGGVCVASGGTFIMNGGEITGNKEVSGDFAYGGGVYVANGGTFTMNGGTVSNNEIDGYVGHVNGAGVYSAGTFTMKGGEIK